MGVCCGVLVLCGLCWVQDPSDASTHGCTFQPCVHPGELLAGCASPGAVAVTSWSCPALCVPSGLSMMPTAPPRHAFGRCQLPVLQSGGHGAVISQVQREGARSLTALLEPNGSQLI